VLAEPLWSSRARRGGDPLGVLLLPVLLVLLAACSTPPERLEVVATPVKVRGSIALQSRAPDGRLVGEEHRPNTEGSLARPLTVEGAPIVSGTTIRQTYRVGPFANGKPMLISRRYRVDGAIESHRLPPVLVVPKGHLIQIEFEVDEQVDLSKAHVTAGAHAVPAAQRSLVLDPIVAREGSVLRGGFGLDPVAQGVAVSPVEFRVVARTDKAAHVVFEKVLDPAEAMSHTWSDFRIDLAELVGQTVHLELSSVVRTPPGADQALAVGFPVWSVPSVLAPQGAAESAPRNVILISLDTLRADYVGAYGQPLETTPTLDRLAAEGVLFENAYTTYPSTTASHMSMLTGLYPSVHGVYAPGQRLPQGLPLLAELLARRGYSTAAVTEDAMLAAGTGFPRGFDSYREYKTPGADTDGHVAEVVDSALAWLKSHRDERFFMFLHTYQVHGPHTPPAAYDVFPTPDVEGLSPAHAEARRGYAGDLLCADAEIARLLGELEALGEDERTVVVITADHGEALGEHGVLGHGWFVIDPVLHIPLIIRAPGLVSEGLRVAAATSLVDVAPTILELAGAAPAGAAPHVMQGKSLVALLGAPGDARSRDRVAYTEKRHENGSVTVVARKGSLKWRMGTSPPAAFFDLASDPGEIAGRSEPEALAEGAALVVQYRAQNQEVRSALGQPRTEQVEVDEATTRKLRALGYIE